jgi:hypothetical protein
MPEFVVDSNAPILVELAPKAGLKKVALRREDLEEQSTKAIEGAMNTIHNTARQVTTTINALSIKPSQVEVDFGIKLEAETGAIITKVGGEATFNVKLTWEFD